MASLSRDIEKLAKLAKEDNQNNNNEVALAGLGLGAGFVAKRTGGQSANPNTKLSPLAQQIAENDKTRLARIKEEQFLKNLEKSKNKFLGDPNVSNVRGLSTNVLNDLDDAELLEEINKPKPQMKDPLDVLDEPTKPKFTARGPNISVDPLDNLDDADLKADTTRFTGRQSPNVINLEAEQVLEDLKLDKKPNPTVTDDAPKFRYTDFDAEGNIIKPKTKNPRISGTSGILNKLFFGTDLVLPTSELGNKQLDDMVGMQNQNKGLQEFFDQNQFVPESEQRKQKIQESGFTGQLQKLNFDNRSPEEQRIILNQLGVTDSPTEKSFDLTQRPSDETLREFRESRGEVDTTPVETVETVQDNQTATGDLDLDQIQSRFNQFKQSGRDLSPEQVTKLKDTAVQFGFLFDEETGFSQPEFANQQFKGQTIGQFLRGEDSPTPTDTPTATESIVPEFERAPKATDPDPSVRLARKKEVGGFRDVVVDRDTGAFASRGIPTQILEIALTPESKRTGKQIARLARWANSTQGKGMGGISGLFSAIKGPEEITPAEERSLALSQARLSLSEEAGMRDQQRMQLAQERIKRDEFENERAYNLQVNKFLNTLEQSEKDYNLKLDNYNLALSKFNESDPNEERKEELNLALKEVQLAQAIKSYNETEDPEKRNITQAKIKDFSDIIGDQGYVVTPLGIHPKRGWFSGDRKDLIPYDRLEGPLLQIFKDNEVGRHFLQAGKDKLAEIRQNQTSQ